MLTTLKRLREWLRKSPHVHIREQGPQSLRDVVELIDRFVGDKMNYELEWDDFISWMHENPNIENIRQRIGATESLLFSGDALDRSKARHMLIDERNRIAALIGLQARPD